MLLRVLSDKILINRDLIRRAAVAVIQNCTETHISNLFKNLLLDNYHLWLWMDNEIIKAMLVTTVSENFIVDKALSVICLYSDIGVVPEDLVGIKKGIIPFAKKYNCEVINFLTSKDNVKRLIEILEPTYEAIYYQINV